MLFQPRQPLNFSAFRAQSSQVLVAACWW